MLNRSVLIVRPKQPYIKWAAQMDDSGMVPDPDGERTAYLVPECQDDDDARNVLEDVYAEIFERELDAWHADEADWPQERTFAMFVDWFEVELHCAVEDLCSYAIDDDED